MLSSIDIRAEAYLIGEIMPACYYWLKYDQRAKLKYLFLGALFTALAMMTKGVFTLATITSGLITLWIVQHRLKTILTPKWLIAILLSFIFIAPEIISLYLQFDSQPDKIVFGMNHVSGIKWFFWDSQFGRFFNTGPISVNKAQDLHYLFFFYTFFWAYLPWWPIFFAALYPAIKEKSSATIFLMASFFITFIIFSLTKFQIDHYTNILFPFASIISANWLYQTFSNNKIKTNARVIKIVSTIETTLALILIIIVIILAPKILSGIYPNLIFLLISGIMLVIFFTKHSSILLKTIIFPTLAICIAFIFAITVNGVEYAKYDAGYQIAQDLNTKTNIIVIGYNLDLLSLDFNSKNPFIPLSIQDNTIILDKKTLNSKLVHLIQEQIKNPANSVVYLVTEDKDKSLILHSFAKSKIYRAFAGTSIETYMRSALNVNKLQDKLTTYDVININPQ